MGFWIFMLIMDLLIPLTMIGFGKNFIKHPPEDMNGGVGYRTTRSMRNKETWTFAHQYSGKLWYRSGVVLLPATIFSMVCVIGKDIDTIGMVGGIVCAIQMIPLIGTIIPTELALKKTFDEHGRRR